MQRLHFVHYFTIFSIVFLLNACSQPEPIEILKKDLKNAPSYTIILEDMKEEGALFPNYYHKYKIVQEKEDRITGWEEVSEEFYKRNKNFLGMALASKTKDGVNATPAPPGYHQVGNENYGQWKKDSNGNSFWEFYGKYALFRDATSTIGGLFGGGRGNGRVYRNEYDHYRGYEQKGRPYYGPRKEYGTQGTYTKKTQPSFFERRKAKAAQQKTDFKSKARSKMGSSRTGRSRSYGSRSSGGK